MVGNEPLFHILQSAAIFSFLICSRCELFWNFATLKNLQIYDEFFHHYNTMDRTLPTFQPCRIQLTITKSAWTKKQWDKQTKHCFHCIPNSNSINATTIQTPEVHIKCYWQDLLSFQLICKHAAFSHEVAFNNTTETTTTGIVHNFPSTVSQKVTAGFA